MRYDPKDPNPAGESLEQQLRWQIEDLQRQLREERQRPPTEPPPNWKPSAITIAAIILGIGVLFAGAFYAGYVPRMQTETAVHTEAEARSNALPRMDVMKVGASTQSDGLKLPGTLQAITEAPVLARTDGYLKSRLVDIGDQVKAGQVLAEIDAPEVDQQIRQASAVVEQAQAAIEQAQASLDQGKANSELARITAGRWRELAKQGVVSKQEDDQYQAQLVSQLANVQALSKAVLAQQSNLAAAKANLARLQDVQGYRVVKAPFDGVITMRNVDVGALVSTGSTLLYRIAQTGTLRTYINVPQANANAIRVGQGAQLSVTNFPGRKFRGSVTRAANALDSNTRTMLVEVDVPNDGALFPGMFVEIELKTASTHPPLVVPASALITRVDGAQVALIRPGGVIHLQKVTVGKDYGDRMEILEGLEEGATILTSPGESAREGIRIELTENP